MRVQLTWKKDLRWVIGLELEVKLSQPLGANFQKPWLGFEGV